MCKFTERMKYACCQLFMNWSESTCLLEPSPPVRCAACQVETQHMKVKPCYCQHADGVFAEALTLERKSETLGAFVFPYLHRLVYIKHLPHWAIRLCVLWKQASVKSRVWLVFRVLTSGDSNKIGIHKLNDGSEASSVALILTWMVPHWEPGLWAGQIRAG